MGEIILFASGKGGVGKTVIAANVGAALAASGFSVLLVDMNLGLRSLDICLGLENKAIYNFNDAINGHCMISKAMIRDRRFEKLYFIAAPQTAEKLDVKKGAIYQFFKKLDGIFDYILIDAASGIENNLELAAASNPDKAVVVTTPEYAAVRDAELLCRWLENKHIYDKRLIINKIKRKIHEKDIVLKSREIVDILRLPITGQIPYDLDIHIAANLGIPFVLFNGNYIGNNLKAIARKISKVDDFASYTDI